MRRFSSFLFFSDVNLHHAFNYRSRVRYNGTQDAEKDATMYISYIWCFVVPECGMPRTNIFEDNKGAVHLAKSTATTSDWRHIDTRRNFIRELI